MMVRVENAQHRFGISDQNALRDWVLIQAKQRMRQRGISARRIGQPDSPSATAPPVTAYVNFGRWVGDCPCGNAEVLLPGAPFLCAVCLNADIGYQWRTVTWPAERGGIETLLASRPRVEVMNWRPGETLQDLSDENAAYRIGALS